MTFTCKLQAFGEEDTYRKVQVPDAEIKVARVAHGPKAILELVFRYGQNDFQPQPNCRSVSGGDLIGFGGTWWLVESFGFSPLYGRIRQTGGAA
jgi:hypothetical protein